MSIMEYLSFGLFFVPLFLWIVLAYKGTFTPEWFFRSRWGKSLRRKMSPKQFQRTCTLFLIAGLLFLGFSLWQLAGGTFKLDGNGKTYSFSDLLKSK